MERRFKVEAKAFFFSVKAAKFRLEERRKGFLGLILVGPQGASWLAATVEEAPRLPATEVFVKSFDEGRTSLSVIGGINKAGRFLEVSVSVDDVRKGTIWIPEARSGRGWRRFVVELRAWLAALASSTGASSEGLSPEEKLDAGSSPSPASSPGVTFGKSFADVVRSSSCEGVVTSGSQILSSQDIDLFPVAVGFELGPEERCAVDCSELEPFSPLSAPVKGMVRRRRKKKLDVGDFFENLDRFLCGLGLQPRGNRVRPGKRVRPFKRVGLDVGPDNGSVLGSDFGLDSGPDSGSDLGSVFGPVPGSVSGMVSGPSEGLSHVLGSGFSGSASILGFGAASDVSDGLGDGLAAGVVGVGLAAGAVGDGLAAGDCDVGPVSGADGDAGDGPASASQVSPVVDDVQVRLDGGRRSTPDASSPESSTGLVWPDGVSGLTGDGWGSFSPLTVMGPTAAGEGAESSLLVSAASVPFGVGSGDETGSCSSGFEVGRAFAGDGSVSTATSDGSAFLHHREVWSVCISGNRPESAIPAGSPRLLDPKHLSFGLAKSQIWLLGWIEDRLKINEEVKDEDHSVFLKAMEEDFRWINLVAREQGRLVVDEEDIRSLSIVACEGGWKVDEEVDARKVAWLTEMKDKLSLSIVWPV
jgi:hypothetical protein